MFFGLNLDISNMYAWLAHCFRSLFSLKRPPSIRLSDVKAVLETAEKGLTGIGLPGVEPIDGIPLLIIRYYEVSEVGSSTAMTDHNGDHSQAVKADIDAMNDLASSLESLHTIILRPVEEARVLGLSSVPESLSNRIQAMKE